MVVAQVIQAPSRGDEVVDGHNCKQQTTVACEWHDASYQQNRKTQKVSKDRAIVQAAAASDDSKLICDVSSVIQHGLWRAFKVQQI